MDLFSVCVTIVSAILGIAYPIITQIISNDKYSSENILKLFDNMPEKKVFLPNLILSLISIAIYLIAFEPIFKFNCFFLDWLLINSAKIFVFVLTIALVINFIRLLLKIEIFYRTSALILYLSKSKYRVIDYNEFETFDCLSDLLYWSIQNQDNNAVKPLSAYFYDTFRLYAEKHKGDKPIIYPDNFYSMIYQTIEKICIADKNILRVIEHRTVSGIWILGEFSKSTKISEESYRRLWLNLKLIIDNDKDEFVFDFWKNSHQYFNFNFEHIQPNYEFIDGGYIVVNQNEIDEKNKLKNKFFEFHIALGGLLLFKQKHQLLKKIFNYTTSIPPDYMLLPKRMIQVYDLFIKFYDPYEINFPWIKNIYSFPGLDGLNAEREIKDWICKYIGLMFIRQLNIKSNYSNYEPNELYNLPEDIQEKRKWAENVKYLKNYIKDLISENDKIFSEFSYTDKIDYLTKADEYEIQIISDFERHMLSKTPEKEKVYLFFETTNNILEKYFKKYESLKNSKEPDSSVKTNAFYITGDSNLTSRDTFIESGIHHINYHSFLAESISKKICNGYFEIFSMNSTNKYFFNQDTIFEAILKMNLKPETHFILVFGYLNMLYYIDILKINNLSKNNFNGVEIKYFSGTSFGLSNSIFIIEKNNLPQISYKPYDDKIEKLYELKKINENYNIYATVSDLNTNNELREEMIKNKELSEDELKKSIYQAVLFKTEIRWEKGIKMVQLVVNDQNNYKRKEDSLDNIGIF